MVNLFLQTMKEKKNRLHQIEEIETKLRKDCPRTAQCCFLKKKFNFTVNMVIYQADIAMLPKAKLSSSFLEV